MYEGNLTREREMSLATGTSPRFEAERSHARDRGRSCTYDKYYSCMIIYYIILFIYLSYIPYVFISFSQY